MNKPLICLALCAFSLTSHAAGDAWGDSHVKLHFAGEALIGMGASLVFKNKREAFAVAFGVGVARELWKREHGYSNFRSSRLVADAAGSALGVYVGGCLIGVRSITCQKAF